MQPAMYTTSICGGMKISRRDFTPKHTPHTTTRPNKISIPFHYCFYHSSISYARNRSETVNGHIYNHIQSTIHIYFAIDRDNSFITWMTRKSVKSPKSVSRAFSFRPQYSPSLFCFVLFNELKLSKSCSTRTSGWLTTIFKKRPWDFDQIHHSNVFQYLGECFQIQS